MAKFRVLPSKVLKAAQDADLARVFIVGKYKNGRMYAAGSSPTFKHLEDLEEFIGKYQDGEYSDDE